MKMLKHMVRWVKVKNMPVRNIGEWLRKQDALEAL